MAVREIEIHDAQSRSALPLLFFRFGPNWTAVLFFAALGTLHLTVWFLTVTQKHNEGYMSLIFGASFSIGAILGYLVRREITVLTLEKHIVIRTGLRRFGIERFVPFSKVAHVRVTLASNPDHKNGLVELVCLHEVIEFPPTSIARIQALCLSITLAIPLIKVRLPEVPESTDLNRVPL